MSDAPVHAAAHVDVDASADLVWDVLVDAAAWPTWYGDIREVQTTGPLASGLEFAFKTGPVAVSATVDLAEGPSRLRFTGRSRGATAVYDFRLEATGGSTAVHAEQTMSGPAAKAMRPMLQKIAETSLPAWLAALQARAEA